MTKPSRVFAASMVYEVREVRGNELMQVWPKLVTLDNRFEFVDGEPTQPLGTDVIVPLEERDAIFLVSVIHIGEVKKEPHVECLPYRSKAETYFATSALLSALVRGVHSSAWLSRYTERPRPRSGAAT